jgi:surfeit locus 1 family protein
MSETRRFPAAATFCTLFAFTVLCCLGTWQVQRLHWKLRMIADFERMYADDAVITPLSAASFDNHDGRFIRGSAEGRLVYALDILVGPRTRDGRPGYHLLTPLRASGMSLLVNRGWLPEAEAQDALEKDRARPEETVAVKGVAHLSERPAMALRNDPLRDRWYWVEIPAMARARNLPDYAPYILQAEEPLGADAVRFPYPLPLPHVAAPANNHMQYAITWFSLAAALLVIYYLRFLKPYFAGKPA